MGAKTENQGRRVLLVHWKDRVDNAFEIFSNLMLFCESYPQYKYNTLNNYLSKAKVAFENEVVKVERKSVLNRPIPREMPTESSRMARVVRISTLDGIDEKLEDLDYWLSKMPAERIAAVTHISLGASGVETKLDRRYFKIRKMKGHGIK
jgi:hypothetical protein